MERSRNFGMDLVRSVAIALVLLSHSVMNLEMSGLLGVELFFVLSGFLIGGILLRTVQVRNAFTASDLKRFLLRRWFRTLPNYFLFLAIYLVFLTFIRSDPPSTDLEVRCLFFLQNADGPTPHWLFGHSWSLCVEEWFYFTFSAALFLAVLFFASTAAGRTRAIWITAGVFIVISTSLRFLYCDRYADVRTFTPSRLDAIMYGVVMAGFSIRASGPWNRPFTMAILGMVVFGAGIAIYGRSGVETALALLLIPVGFACSLPVFYILPRPIAPVAGVVERISIWSYSIYLCHVIVLVGLQPVVGYSSFSWDGKLAYKILGIGVVIALSAFVYRFYEQPMLKLRDRFT